MSGDGFGNSGNDPTLATESSRRTTHVETEFAGAIDLDARNHGIGDRCDEWFEGSNLGKGIPFQHVSRRASANSHPTTITDIDTMGARLGRCCDYPATIDHHHGLPVGSDRHHRPVRNRQGEGPDHARRGHTVRNRGSGALTSSMGPGPPDVAGR